MMSQRRRFRTKAEALQAEAALFEQWLFVPGLQISCRVAEDSAGAWLVLCSSNCIGVDDGKVLLPGFEICDSLGIS